MSNGNPIVGGSGMSVLLGVIFVVGPWLSGEAITLLQKFGLTVFGGLLIFLGLLFSKS